MHEQTPSDKPQGRSCEDGEENRGEQECLGKGEGGTTPEATQRKTVIIYALEDPETNEIRYVGKTVIKLYRRLCQHYQGRKNSYKDSWITSLRSRGLKPIISELDRIENSDDTDWQDVERFYICYLRFLGCRLTNLDVGGTGGNLKSEETKKKIGDSHRGRKHTEESRKKFSESHTGKRLSPEHVANMSKAVKGVPRGPYSKERVEKTAAALRGKKKKPRTAEHQAKLTASQIGREVKPETKAKISAAQKGKKRGPYSKERIEKSVAGMTPEARKKMSEASLRRWAELKANKQEPPPPPCNS